MAKSAYSIIDIDPVKFEKWIAGKKVTAANMSRSIGYHDAAIGKAKEKRTMSVRMFKALETRYGLQLEDIIKDDTTEPAAKAEPEATGHDCKANAQAMELLAKAADEEQRMLGELERRLKSTVEKLDVLKDLANNITAGFHVQTTPRILTEDIAIGVCDGMGRWWNKNKSNIIDQFRGAMCSAYIDALNKRWGKQGAAIKEKP